MNAIIAVQNSKKWMPRLRRNIPKIVISEANDDLPGNLSCIFNLCFYVSMTTSASLRALTWE